MRVYAPVPFRYPPQTGKDYPFGYQDIGDDSLARTLIAAGLVLDATQPGGGIAGTSSGKVVTLTGDYTFVASDDGSTFKLPAGSSITLTLPTGLGWVTGVIIQPASSGSATVTPSGGATINGATTPQVVNIITNPVPAALVATNIVDNFGLTTAGTAFSALTGQPTDNTNLSTALAAKMALPPGGNKLTGAYTLAATDNGAFLWLAAQATDKIISVPSSLAASAPFICVLGYLNSTAAAGRCNIKSAGGATLNSTISQSTGALATLTNGLFMGTNGSNNVAACLICSEGASPGGAFLIYPLTGAFATS